MASYLSQSQKLSIEAILDNVHDTFARTITIFKIGQRVAIASNSQYNSFYRQNSSNTETVEVSQSFNARIKYVKAEEEILSHKDGSTATGGQTKIILPAGSVKIKVDVDGYNYIKEAKRIEFDGQRFSIVSDARPIGMFGPRYYEFLLAPLDE